MKQDLTALFDRATALHEAGRWQDAEREYRAVLSADAGHADALHQLGLLAYQNGRNDVAIDLIGRAVSRAPDCGAYHNTLGGALLEAGRAKDAISSFERAARLMPASIEAKNNLANAMHADCRLDEAIAIYRAVVKEAPADADVNNNLGRALEAAGHLDEAVHHFRIARASRPTDALILSHLGTALCAQRSYDEGAALCEEAATLAPDSVVALINLGNARMCQRRVDAAIAAYTKAIEIVPDRPELQMNLGIAYHAAGNWKDAAVCFEKVLAAKADDRAGVALARTYVSLGKLEEAVGLFRSALEVRPEDKEVRLGLGLALNDLGHHAEGLGEIAKGPGLARLTITNESSGAGERRIPLAGAAPNFIGCWKLKDPELCARLIDFFESNAALHRQGRTNRGIDLAVKQATDLVIFPSDLAKPDYAPVAAYLRELEACVRDYARQWPHFAEIFAGVDLVPFQIQRYKPGEHFQSPHSERVSFGLMHRVLAWMTYLNEVDEGGQTRFHHYDLDVTPERGKTLIWPAEWTHVHAGQIVKRGTKYIITGWMHFPHPSA